MAQRTPIDDQLAEIIDEVRAIRRQLSLVITNEEFNELEKRLSRVEKHLGLV